MKIKKGDNVKVIAGKDKGTTGTISKVLPEVGKVVIEGVNVKKKHQRARQRGEKGQIIEQAAPIDVSNVQILDPKTKEPTRIGYRFSNDGTKERYAKKSGQTV